MSEVIVPYDEIGISVGTQAPKTLVYDGMGCVCVLIGYDNDSQRAYYEDGRGTPVEIEMPDPDDLEYEPVDIVIEHPSVEISLEPAILTDVQKAGGRGGADVGVLISDDEETEPPTS